MRTYEECFEILELKKSGLNSSEISRRCNIPRGTVRDIVRKFWACGEMAKHKGLKIPHIRNVVGSNPTMPTIFEKDYSFLLGMYLGDGCINKEPRTYKMRIALHSEQNKVLRLTKEAIEKIFTENKVNLIKVKNAKAYYLYFYSKKLSWLFPQHGKGKKHNRRIELGDWQKDILNRNPWDFLKGLVFSDGCRYESYGKVCYQFTNKSIDLINLFCDYGKLCGIHMIRSQPKKNGCICMSIYRRESVKKMEQHIGSKYE